MSENEIFLSIHTIENIKSNNQEIDYQFTPYSVYIDHKGMISNDNANNFSLIKNIQIPKEYLLDLKKYDKIFFLHEENETFAFSTDNGLTYKSIKKPSFFRRIFIKDAIRMRKNKLSYSDILFCFLLPLYIFLITTTFFTHSLNQESFSTIFNIFAFIVQSCLLINSLKIKSRYNKIFKEKEIFHTSKKTEKDILLLPHTQEIIKKVKIMNHNKIKT